MANAQPQRRQVRRCIYSPANAIGFEYIVSSSRDERIPPVVPASQANWIKLEAKTLFEMLTATSFAISHDETRYALNGVAKPLGVDKPVVAVDAKLGGRHRP